MVRPCLNIEIRKSPVIAKPQVNYTSADREWARLSPPGSAGSMAFCGPPSQTSAGRKRSSDRLSTGKSSWRCLQQVAVTRPRGFPDGRGVVHSWLSCAVHVQGLLLSHPALLPSPSEPVPAPGHCCPVGSQGKRAGGVQVRSTGIVLCNQTHPGSLSRTGHPQTSHTPAAPYTQDDC